MQNVRKSFCINMLKKIVSRSELEGRCHNGRFHGVRRVVPKWQLSVSAGSVGFFQGEGSSRELSGEFSVAEHKASGDQHVIDANRVLVGFEKCGTVGDGGGVEDGDVGDGADDELSPVAPAKSLCGQGGHLVYRGFEFQNGSFSDVVSQHPGVAPVGAWMRIAFSEAEHAAIGGDGGMRIGHHPIDIAVGAIFEGVIDSSDSVAHQLDQQFRSVA